MAEQASSPQPVETPRHRVQFGLAFLAGVAVALIGYRLVQDRVTRPPEALQAETASDHSQSKPVSEAKSAKPLPSKRIDLNKAERHELLQLPGVGPAMADGILAYRDAKGPFQRVEELRSVRGVGVSTLERLKPWLTLDPTAGDEPIVLSRKPPAATKPSGGKKPTPTLDEQIDLNTAPVAELERLPGIGLTLAQRIVDEREKKPFARVEDLKRVNGIGPKKMEQVKPFVRIGD